MSTYNMFELLKHLDDGNRLTKEGKAALAEQTTQTIKTTKDVKKAKTPVVEKSAGPRQLASVKIPSNIPVSEMYFVQLMSLIIKVLGGFTQKSVFGNTFWDNVEGLRSLIGQIGSLYESYCDEDVDGAIWKRNIRAKHFVPGCDDKAVFVDGKYSGQNLNLLVRLMCAQIRVVDEKKLIENWNPDNENIINLQKEFVVLVEEFLGEQFIAEINDREVLMEPLSAEINDAFIEAANKKQEAIAAREKEHERIAEEKKQYEKDLKKTQKKKNNK
jgi:phenylpyruvate tautomerase PptA (4-oxalocrotonate tautomerase family)